MSMAVRIHAQIAILVMADLSGTSMFTLVPLIIHTQLAAGVLDLIAFTHQGVQQTLAEDFKLIPQ